MLNATLTNQQFQLNCQNSSPSYVLYIGLLMVLLNTGKSEASGFYLGYDNFEYQTVIDGINLDYVPTGPAIGGSLDIGESSYLQIMYGNYDDAIDLNDNGTSNFESSLKGVGFGKNLRDWRVYGSYTVTKDELITKHGRDLDFLTTSNIESSVFEFNSSYQWVSGGWATTALAGLQYAKVDLDAFLDQSSTRTTTESDSLYVNGRISGDYYFPVATNSGFYLGASVSWYERISENRIDTTLDLNMSGSIPPPVAVPPPPAPTSMSSSGQGSDPKNPPPPLNNGGGGGGGGNGGNGGNRQANNNGSNNLTNNRTFGASFGLLGIYGVLDINEHWSLDWNSTFGFAGEGNFDAHSLTLNYYF